MHGLKGLGNLMGAVEVRDMARLDERLAKLRAELQEHPLVELEEFTVREPLSEAKRAELLERVTLPAPLIEAYQRVDGFSFRWSLKELPAGLDADPTCVRGEANVRSLVDVVDNREFFEDVHDNPTLEPYHPVTVDMNLVAFALRVEDGVAEPELYAMSDTGQADKTDLSFAKHVDRLLLCRGFDRWHGIAAHPTGQPASLLHTSLTALFGADGRLDLLFPGLGDERAKIAKRREALDKALQNHGVAARVEPGRLSDFYPTYVVIDDDFHDAESLSRVVSDVFRRPPKIEAITHRAIGDVAFLRESDPR